MKLSELVDFNPSQRLPDTELVPFVDMASLPQHGRDIRSFELRPPSSSGARFSNGDTLVARITPCLENGKGAQVHILDHDQIGQGSTEFIVMRAKHPSDRAFVYYLSRHPVFRRFAIKQMTGTSGRQRVAWQSLAGFEFTEIHKDERKAISSVLSSLDDKIELNRRMNETLEATAQAIFRDWFVDFGPTRAKLEGRAPYLAPDIWSLFSDTITGDGMPEGWDLVPLNLLIEVNPTEQLARGTNSPYLDMASIPTAGPNPAPPVLREYSSGMRFRNGDALLARITPCLENGKTAFVQNLPEGEIGWGSTEFIVLRSRPPLPKPVAYLIARNTFFRANAIRSMTGTSGRQRASNEAISAYPLARPSSNDLWLQFGAVVDPMFHRIAANEAESQTLIATRDFLLPKLMSGEIRVREAEKAVEVAV